VPHTIAGVSTLDDRIDALYALPLTQFTAERNALAKSLAGSERDRVKALEKPTTVPWAANLLFWRERKTFDRLVGAGQALRAGQVAALKGKTADIRELTAKHREALADAVSTARQLAADSGSAPDADAVSRMLEALSVAPQLPDRPGRWTEAIQPAGFEALAGITPVAHVGAAHRAEPSRAPEASKGGHPHKPVAGVSKRDAAADKRRLEAEAARRKAADAAVRSLKQEVDRTTAAEARAAAQVEHARQQLAHAEAAHNTAREHSAGARKRLADAEASLAKI
jgi:hypothetical protein